MSPVCAHCQKNAVDQKDDYCYGCHRLVCVRCCFQGDHFLDGAHR